MDWEKLYKERWTTAKDAVKKVIKPGDTVVWGGGHAVQPACDAILEVVKEGGLDNLTLEGNLMLSNPHLDDPAWAEHGARYKSIFYGGIERQGVAAGNTTYVPMVYSNMGRWYEMLQPDVGILEMTPPDENGMCNLGCLTPGYGSLVLSQCKHIIAGINEKLPRVNGDLQQIPVERIDAFIENNSDLPIYPVLRPSEIDNKICDFILEEVPDGACLQFGFGGMPNALGYGMRVKKHLGIHTEMLTASMIDLIKEGVVDNSMKGYMPGKTVCAFTLGDQSQYDYVNNNKDCLFLPYSITNDPYNIAQNDNFVSVNNALEIDLKGAVCADTIGFRQFSGVGGQIDFVRGATMSKGGKSFIALESTFTAKDGTKKSHIVLDLAPGAQVTTLRSEIMYVVTEYGCVNLWGQDEPTRAKLLISIAHPDFRDELTFQAKKAGILY